MCVEPVVCQGADTVEVCSQCAFVCCCPQVRPHWPSSDLHRWKRPSRSVWFVEILWLTNQSCPGNLPLMTSATHHRCWASDIHCSGRGRLHNVPQLLNGAPQCCIHFNVSAVTNVCSKCNPASRFPPNGFMRRFGSLTSPLWHLFACLMNFTPSLA